MNRYDLEQVILAALKEKLIGTLSQKTAKKIVDVSVKIDDEETEYIGGCYTYTTLDIHVLTETAKTKKHTWERYSI